MPAENFVINDPQGHDFQVNRRALVDPQVLEAEMRRIFDTCWIYVGHESEVREPGDFKTRNVCGRPIIFCRDSGARIRVYLNACRHRGAIVCREPEGNAKGFFCFYHGWSYNRDGALDGVPGQASYPPSFDRCKLGLAEPAQVAAYKGFVFLSFNPKAMPLVDYLAGACEYIDLIVDQSPSGRMEVLRGTQEYDIKANWKLLVENSFDDYHLMTTHSTWLNYMKRSGVEIKRQGARKRPRGDRQRQLPRPACGQVDSDLRRSRPARDRAHSRRVVRAPGTRACDAGRRYQP